MREVGRGPCGNVRHGEERFWRSAAVLQRPWGSGAKLGTRVGREVVKRGRRLGGKCDSATQWARAAQIGHNWIFIDFYTFLASVHPRYPTFCPSDQHSCTVQAMSSRFPACCLSGQQYSCTYSCDPSQPQTCARCSSFIPSSCQIST
jgi:hypothetical protein